MSPLLSILEEIRTRPVAMYVGEASLSRLADFLRGYDLAVERLGNGRDPLLLEFREWLYTRLGLANASWDSLILARAGDQASALRDFWKLLDEFLAARLLAASANGVPDHANGTHASTTNANVID